VVVVNPKSNGLSGTFAGGTAGVVLRDSLVVEVVVVKADEPAIDVEVGTAGNDVGAAWANDDLSARFSLGRRSSTLGLKNLLAAPFSTWSWYQSPRSSICSHHTQQQVSIQLGVQCIRHQSRGTLQSSYGVAVTCECRAGRTSASLVPLMLLDQEIVDSSGERIQIILTISKAALERMN